MPEAALQRRLPEIIDWPQQEVEEHGEETTGKIAKQAVLYIHKEGTEYTCGDCAMFLAELERCNIHGREDVIRAHGSCGFFIFGQPMGGEPRGEVTPLQSGYTEAPNGFSCKRCEYFLADQMDCRKVDRYSEGDDPGDIHPDGCCNAWEAKADEGEPDHEAAEAPGSLPGYGTDAGGFREIAAGG